MRKLKIKNARTNNLKNISLEIPHNKFVVVTGVSGSGKSSLAFDIIASEGQRRYFETLPSFARQFPGKLNQPDVDSIEGLSPVIAISQKTTNSSVRSTVGTMSDIYDLLRLLFARVGNAPKGIQLSRSLFSFNAEQGKCSQCNGIGKEEKIDINKLVSDPNKTIREGALAPTLPNGYIMYSQVTIDVLNQVCEAEGFNVDIPWSELSDENREVILHGSNKIKVPFGKHSLESRLKWSGIKAKPREEGFYKGMIPIMSDILRRDRNANILKYVSAVTCSSCDGKRLNEKALSVQVHNKSIAVLAEMEISSLRNWLTEQEWCEVGAAITHKILEKANIMADLGIAHLKVNQLANSLSAGEAQRIRVINQLSSPISDVLYVLDEPSIGLHPAENRSMIAHLKGLVQKGNTVIVVEHDLETIKNADWIVDIGPSAGSEGGNLLFNGSFSDFLKSNVKSPTLLALSSKPETSLGTTLKKQEIELIGCSKGNLKGIDVSFISGGLNVVSGRSGSGTKELVLETLKPIVEGAFSDSISGVIKDSKNLDLWDSCIFVDQTPIGRTPRSNPATYLGISDSIRDLFASLPSSKENGFTRSRFSFNNKGGRCETCQGAGKIQIGMHFLGYVDIKCGTCGGKRFNDATLAITSNGKSIADIYNFSVDEALTYFTAEDNKFVKKIRKGLLLLHEIGLGYLKLGQSSTTLSGGEAQRIKIANQLQKKDTGKTLFVLIEPSIGLHTNDIKTLLRMFDRIRAKGNTLVCLEQDEHIIAASHRHIVLGPEGGKNGGYLVHHGTPRIQEFELSNSSKKKAKNRVKANGFIQLNNVTTNGLKNVDVTIPKQQLTVVTGVSGSGKSSLVYDTLFSEANARFSESLSTYNRSFIQQNSTAKLDSFSGLTPSIALKRRHQQAGKRSTVGTLSGVYDQLRLLFARWNGDHTTVTAQHFSFNHHLGACPTCKGYGVIEQCDPDKVIENPLKSIFDGAFSKNKSLDYYSNPDGQFIATLKTIAANLNWNFEQPWSELSDEQKELVLYGTGDRTWNVEWHFQNKSRSGVQQLSTKWLGICGYINDEFERKRSNKNIKWLEALMHDVRCPECNGGRLKTELLDYKVLNKNIAEWSQLSIHQILVLLDKLKEVSDDRQLAVAGKVAPGMKQQLQTLSELGLSYLSLDRIVSTLSGGEYQRVLIAGQLSANLHGVTYVLDEPTIGLDSQQVASLVKILRNVIRNGNTVIVIEHARDLIQCADYIVEMGPEAGQNGGRVVFEGAMENLKERTESRTYQLLNSATTLPKISTKRGDTFGIFGATRHNLKNINVAFYKGTFSVITGVSGSGKTTLLRDVLYRSAQTNKAVGCSEIYGFENFVSDNTLYIGQEPLAANRLMVPALYLGLLPMIQTLFSKTKAARELDLKKADFSFLSKKGKCPTCSGNGKIKTSLDFMSDVWTDCDTCFGKRYSSFIEQVQWNGKTISDVLQMNIETAAAFFSEVKKLANFLTELQNFGLGHLTLGQPGNTLSGGESQRIKLAKHLFEGTNESKLFLLDEPGTGLHLDDLRLLINILQKLINLGATIICIEHNKHLIESAGQVIHLGPGSGESGGEIINVRS